MTDKIVKEINNYNFWIFLHTHTEKSKIKLLKGKFIQIEKKQQIKNGEQIIAIKLHRDTHEN